MNKKELLFKIDETLEETKRDNVRDMLAKEMRRKMKNQKNQMHMSIIWRHKIWNCTLKWKE